MSAEILIIDDNADIRSILNELKISDYHSFDKKINKNLYNFINIKNSVNNKTSYGGTNMVEVKKMIALAKKDLKK